MGIHKTSAIILSVMPWRESSAIVNLYTGDHGRVSGIAKGIRRRSKNQVPLERGFLVDLVLYIKNNRDLQILTDIHINDYYPELRTCLHKAALRDAAFELLLKSVLLSESHPELFLLLRKFLDDIHLAGHIGDCFVLLWKFYFKVAELLGFAIHFESCRICGQGDLASRGGFLAVENGGFYCTGCAAKESLRDTFIGGAVLRKLTGGLSVPLSLSSKELMCLTRIAASYCRFHLDIRSELKTLDFIEETFVKL